MNKSINNISLDHAEISLREDGIVEINTKSSSELGIEQCMENQKAYAQLLEAKRYPMIHIGGKYVTIDKKARKYAASEEALRFSVAEAYVITSLAHKILAKFYLKVDKPSVPTKFFSTKVAAENWLKEFL